MNRYIKIVLLAAAATLVFQACASATLVKPGAAKVKTIAIVSAQTNKVVYNRNGRGGLTSIGTMAAGNSENPLVKKFVNDVTNVFISDFNTIEGWKVKDLNTAPSSEAYKSVVSGLWDGLKIPLFDKRTHELFTVAAGNLSIMHPLKNLQSWKETNIRFAQLARDLNVDAVAFLEFDLAYRPQVSMMGNGTATADVGVRLYVINTDGEVAISTFGFSEDAINETNGTLAMLANNVLFDNNTVAVFTESGAKSVRSMVSKIKKEREVK